MEGKSSTFGRMVDWKTVREKFALPSNPPKLNRGCVSPLHVFPCESRGIGEIFIVGHVDKFLCELLLFLFPSCVNSSKILITHFLIVIKINRLVFKTALCFFRFL